MGTQTSQTKIHPIVPLVRTIRALPNTVDQQTDNKTLPEAKHTQAVAPLLEIQHLKLIYGGYAPCLIRPIICELGQLKLRLSELSGLVKSEQ